jgi:hypothetical protein
MAMLRGSCQCGGVKFEITGPLMGVGNCHCSQCRKAQGAAFRSRARVQRADFKWVRGEDMVKFYQSSPDFHRGFCGVCGSPVVNWNGPESRYGKANPASLTTLGIALGSLDDDPGVGPAFHAFVTYKAPWFSITDDLPQCAEYPE